MTEGLAHGRVNLIGEHTDYNDGYVLPTAIPQSTGIRLAPRGDDRVLVHSQGMTSGGFRLGAERPDGTWVDYVRGITWALREEGAAIGGFEAIVRSDVPIGSGLSSSAALEIALLRALRSQFSLPFDDLRLARLGHRAETEFVGVPVGLLDQMACSFADLETALFLDLRTLQLERIPLPEPAGIAVIDSGERHSNSSGLYRIRREECEEAARLLGVPALRDLGPSDLDAVRALRPPLDRRARHVITENQRVLDAVGAMKQGDVRALGRLFDASHRSMRDDFECSTRAIDALVEVARGVPGVLGVRLTGGGFGGAVVMLAEAERTADAARTASRRSSRIAGLEPLVLVPVSP